MLDRKIGQDWRERFEELGNLNEHADTETLSDFIRVKEEKKAQLFRYIEQTEGVKIGGNRILFAQVKRLHEYKRQLMTAFALLRLYYDLKNGKIKSFDFDVTDQVAAQPQGGVIVVKGIEISDEEGTEGGSGFDVDVEDWGDYEDIELPL